MLRTIGSTVVAAAAVALTCTGTAQAETNPACPSGVTQIGATSYIKHGGTTIASVKQFKGCNKNWGYVYVWDSWRADHTDYTPYAGVQVRGAEFPSGYRAGARGQQELWSYGTDTLTKCTRGYGSIVAQSYGGGVETEERC
ncbi:hypothetical protein SAMN05216188_11616 [Lentzea xinjiangensis]|uniref:DUF2690 domain-containing protein n=1 Tax=Lentzea xinjiangensis TaxID=402600 RepID=A0A1H9SAV9_9PSEU|nr:hypothetical protein [Lentzea xinjiangensis]SER82176.1 hypothetical protein SAMN05216188_11616 [Lentzea xinjiangensis]